MNPQLAQEKGARFLLLAASLVIIIAGLKAASSLFLPFLSAIFLAMISLPLLNWFLGKNIPRPVAVLLTIFIALGAVALLVVLVSGSVADFTTQLPRYQAGLRSKMADVIAWLQVRGIDLGEEFNTQMINPGQALDLMAGTLRGVAAVLSNVFLVSLTIVFILFEASGFPMKFRAAFGEPRESRRFANIKYEVQHYLAIKTLISLVTGALVAAAMSIIGVDFPLLWGVLAFLMNYIPALGSILAAIPPVLLALVQLDAGHAISVALVFLAINLGLGNFVEPYLMGRGLGLSTLVVFASLVFWGWIWGPIGMLVSVPMTMVIKIMLENTEDLRWVAILLGTTPKTREIPSRKRA